MLGLLFNVLCVCVFLNHCPCLMLTLCSVTELPGPPTNIAVTNIGPRSVVLQFKPGYDGKTSISRWLVEAQVSQLQFRTDVQTVQALIYVSFLS